VRAFAALLRDRANAAAHHRVFGLDRVGALLDRQRVHAGIHANRVARARLDAQTAGDAAQLVDLEHRRALLDRLRGALLGDDRDAVGRADRRAAHAGDAANGAVIAQHEAVEAAEPLRVLHLLFGVLDGLDLVAPRVVEQRRTGRDALFLLAHRQEQVA